MARPARAWSARRRYSVGRLIPVTRISSPTSVPSSGARHSASHSASSAVAVSSPGSGSGRLTPGGGAVVREISHRIGSCRADRALRYLVQFRPLAGVASGGFGDGLVSEQVGAGPRAECRARVR